MAERVDAKALEEALKDPVGSEKPGEQKPSPAAPASVEQVAAALAAKLAPQLTKMNEYLAALGPILKKVVEYIDKEQKDLKEEIKTLKSLNSQARNKLVEKGLLEE